MPSTRDLYLLTLKLVFDKLTRAQQQAIHHAWTDREDNLRLDPSVCRIPTKRALTRMGIVESDSWVLTPLGRDIFRSQT